MTCEACRDQEEKDGQVPRCRTDAGCLIPPLDGQAAKVMAARRDLALLREITGPEAVMAMHGMTESDVRFLADAEAMIREIEGDKSDG